MDDDLVEFYKPSFRSKKSREQEHSFEKYKLEAMMEDVLYVIDMFPA